MRSARRNLGAQLLMILVVLIGLGFGYSFAREVVQAQHLAGQAEASRQENERIAAENRKLQRDLQYYQSDAYAELRARTDLNMRRPDEQVILPVLPDGETTITSPDSDMAA
jgi:cell division protein FtsB